MILELDKLKIELDLLSDILDKCAYTLNDNTRQIIYDIRLRKQIKKVNLELKYRSVNND